ncbi:MAG TPA: RICIN domain-containing protein [Bryobacteraceae bacterium]|jgi:hypothetical protein|nr:RICIN domain-containing protein [Bryobacteraceae bacterium]
MNATKSVLYPDFNGSGWVGMPYTTVPGSTPRVPVSFAYAGESDAGPYPIPANVVIENGGDRHALIIDTTNCILYELYGLSDGSNGWHAGSGAIFPLNSNALRPAGWTSADAAGLPIFPGMLRVDEVLAGHINHALRLTADHTRNQYIWPARHEASKLSGSQYPPMGQRFRLKASFDISGYAPQAQVILQALKTYGLILADNGPSWDLTGMGDSRWDDAALNSIKHISGNNFEAIDESSLMVNPNSAQVAASTTSLPTGWVHLITSFSNKCLDIEDSPNATQPTATADQWACGDSTQTQQQFQFIPVKGGYEIQVRSSGLALQVIGGSSAENGARIEQWGYEGSAWQIWSVTSNNNGTYDIHPTSDPAACMYVNGPYNQNGVPVIQNKCNGAANQIWRLVPVK